MALGDPAGVGDRAGPGNQLVERGECAIGFAGGELGIAEAAKAEAAFACKAHVARPCERSLGELDSFVGVTGRERQV